MPGWGRGFGWYGWYGWGRGNPYPYCRRFPWLPRGWWWSGAACYGSSYYGSPYYGSYYRSYYPTPYTTYPYSYSTSQISPYQYPAASTSKQEVEMIKQEISMMEQHLKAIVERLKQLKGE